MKMNREMIDYYEKKMKDYDVKVILKKKSKLKEFIIVLKELIRYRKVIYRSALEKNLSYEGIKTMIYLIKKRKDIIGKNITVDSSSGSVVINKTFADKMRQ